MPPFYSVGCLFEGFLLPRVLTAHVAEEGGIMFDLRPLRARFGAVARK